MSNGWPVFLLMLLTVPAASAVEVAPRISDREIIESLAELKAGQKALEEKMDQRFALQEENINQRFQAVDERAALFEKSVHQRFSSLEENIDQRFQVVDQRFEAVYQRFDAVDQRFDAVDQRFKAVDQRFKSVDQRFDGVDRRLDDLHDTMLTLFSALIALIVALFGYIAWDRRTMVRPLQERMERMERDLHLDLELHNQAGSRVSRVVDALRDFAEVDAKMAEALRGRSLL